MSPKDLARSHMTDAALLINQARIQPVEYALEPLRKAIEQLSIAEWILIDAANSADINGVVQKLREGGL